MGLHCYWIFQFVHRLPTTCPGLPSFSKYLCRANGTQMSRHYTTTSACLAPACPVGLPALCFRTGAAPTTEACWTSRPRPPKTNWASHATTYTERNTGEVGCKLPNTHKTQSAVCCSAMADNGPRERATCQTSWARRKRRGAPPCPGKLYFPRDPGRQLWPCWQRSRSWEGPSCPNPTHGLPKRSPGITNRF